MTNTQSNPRAKGAAKGGAKASPKGARKAKDATGETASNGNGHVNGFGGFANAQAQANARKAEEKASAKSEEAIKAKREKWCREAGIEIDLNAKIEGLDENAILDIEEACIAAIREELGFAPDEIIRDGQTHYFGDYANGFGGSGWYRYHDDPRRPWMSFGNRRKDEDGVRHIWRGEINDLAPEQLEAWELRHAAELLIDEKEREEGWAEAAEKAREDFGYMSPANPNNYYLLKKKVGLHGDIRQCNRRLIGDKDALVTLVIPVRDIKGEIISLHFLMDSYDKWFMPGCAVKGGMHLIGPKITDIVVVVEGYATGASVYETTGLPVAIAFDAGNLIHVARALRKKHPKAEIIFASDNDLFLEKTHGVNIGTCKAETAAEEVNGVVVPAPFDASELKGEKSDPTDWNDLVALHGKEAADACFKFLLEDAKAFREAARLKAAGASYEQAREALRNHVDPDIIAWVKERGAPNNERELHCVYDRAIGGVNVVFDLALV
jgi:phage/plasmid primase-like uncharacterized protein